MQKLLRQVKTTKTTDFLLPLLGKSKTWYAPLLINAYLSDTGINNKYPNSISILIQFSGNAKFDVINNTLRDMDTFIDSYDILDGKFTMFIVGLPERFIEDYSLMLKGKYSKISKEAKDLLLIGRGSKSPMPYILRKDSKLRAHWESELGTNLGDLDVWSVFEIRDEIFSIEDFPIKPSVF
jgi:hypothetical protein